MTLSESLTRKLALGTPSGVTMTARDVRGTLTPAAGQRPRPPPGSPAAALSARVSSQTRTATEWRARVST
jgi:hypothetical protein